MTIVKSLFFFTAWPCTTTNKLCSVFGKLFMFSLFYVVLKKMKASLSLAYELMMHIAHSFFTPLASGTLHDKYKFFAQLSKIYVVIKRCIYDRYKKKNVYTILEA
jgi:hypothetical protein